MDNKDKRDMKELRINLDDETYWIKWRILCIKHGNANNALKHLIDLEERRSSIQVVSKN